MKKILMGSLSLMIFSCAILVFQISCRKDAIAQTTTGTNKILFFKNQTTNVTGPFETWIMDEDGSNQTQFFVTIPGRKINRMRLSQDEKKLIIDAIDLASLNTNYPALEIFTANIDGSNVQQITNYNATGNNATLMDY